MSKFRADISAKTKGVSQKEAHRGIEWVPNDC
jgi:hypothetical protein